MSPPVSPPPLEAMWLPEFDASPGPFEASSVSTSELPRPSDSDSSIADRAAKTSRAATLAVQRRRAYQSRKKSEAAELRAASAALTTKRDELMVKHEAHWKRLLSANGGRRYGGGWQGVAARQLRSRIDAKRLNHELREQLRRSHEETEQLVGLVVSKLSLVDMQWTSRLLDSGQPKDVLQFTANDLPTVKALAVEVAAIVGRADAVMSQCEVPVVAADQACNYSRTWQWDPESNSAVFEIVETRHVAFAFDVALAALEKTVALMFATQCEPAFIHLPGGMIALKFSLNGVDDERRAKRIESVYVGKMIVHGDHATLCWRCQSDEPATGNQFQETGWGTATQHSGASSDAGTTFTYYSRLNSPAKSASARDSELKRFVEMIPSAEEETAVWYRAMERVVMQEGLSKRLNEVASS